MAENPYANAAKNRIAADREKRVQQMMREERDKRAEAAELRQLQMGQAYDVASTALQAVRIVIRDLRKTNSLSPTACQQLSELDLGPGFKDLLRLNQPIDAELKRETPKKEEDA